MVSRHYLPYLRRRSTPTGAYRGKCQMLLAVAFVSCVIYMSHMHHLVASSLMNCASDNVLPGDVSISQGLKATSHGSSFLRAQKIHSSTFGSSNFGNKTSCQKEYERLHSLQTPGLTQNDLRRSQAWIGNQYRLTQMMDALSSRQRPVVAVVAGGSISLGHGVTPDDVRYSPRLERWMNEMYPLDNGETNTNVAADKNLNKEQINFNKQHKVINVAAHGADMCAMAKRLNILYSDLSSQMPPSSNNEPDLIILEFGVNDYQGQDHLITIDHKTSVFFDGFRDLTLCAEVVIYSLLTHYKNTAIVFLEMQTAILTRKTGMLLHTGVAMQYEIPVISYGEVMFRDFFRLIRILEEKDKQHGTNSYTFTNEEWMLDGGLGGASNTPDSSIFNNPPQNLSEYASAILPYPHGCSPCQSQHIVPQFRPGGCKSVCTFLDRSNIIHTTKLKCDAKRGQIPLGHNECFVPFLAHDAIHPSAAGHGIIMDLIVHLLASAQLRSCEDGQLPPRDVLPLTTFVADSFEELVVRGDFLWVHDVARIFSRWDALVPMKGGGKEKDTSSGFQLYADDDLKQRPGWIATNPDGGEKITFSMDLPKHGCYVVYLAILRSYKGMGTMSIEVKDYGDTKENSKRVPLHTTTKRVDGLWSAPISVWSDVRLTEDYELGCTGYCEVTVTTDPIAEGRVGNKVKLLTLSARRCSSLAGSSFKHKNNNY